MPKFADSKSSKIRRWIEYYPELKTDGTSIYCVVCDKAIGKERKSQVDEHCSTSAHLTLKEAKNKKAAPVQQLITESCSSVNKRKKFLTDLCYSMVASNIPLYKVNLEPFKNFLHKYTEQIIPDESTLRKTYLEECYKLIMKKIKTSLSDDYLFLMVDETTDARGLYICSLIVGILHPEKSSTPYLISCKVLEKTNNETVSRFANTSLADFFPDTTFHQKILLFISDAAPYMIKAGQNLKVFYPNMVHVTCIAHGLSRVAEKVRETFPEVNKLVNNGKKVFLKAPHRVVQYKTAMDCQLPPEVVITRWGTWIEAANFYAENFPKFKDLIFQLEENSVALTKLKHAMNCPSIICDLAFIRTHFGALPTSIKKLEERNLSLSEQINIIEGVRKKLEDVRNAKGIEIAKKFRDVFNKNPGYNTLKNINDCLNGDPALSEGDPMLLSCYKNCPLTSVDVERSFSKLKNMLSDRRYCFGEKNLEMSVVLNFNSECEM